VCGDDLDQLAEGFAFDRAGIVRYGLTVKELADTMSTTLAGREANEQTAYLHRLSKVR
jgi:Cu/Ag efflux pump CusA